MTEATSGASYVSRIIGLVNAGPDERAPHPENWQTHPESQKAALRGILAEVGITDVILGYRSEVYNPGKITIIDGHLRDEIAPQEWPILLLDITDEEARYILATHDPVANMSVAIPAKAEVLFASIRTSNQGVSGMLSALRDSNAKLLSTVRAIQRQPGGASIDEQLERAPAGFSMFPEPDELQGKPEFFDASKLAGAATMGAQKQTYLIYISFSDRETFRDGLRLLSNGERDEDRPGMTMPSLDGDEMLPVWYEMMGIEDEEEAADGT